MSKDRQILVVEDDPGLREALADTLGLARCQVHLAADARQALALLHSEDIHLVISDVQMPGMDGHALLRRVKQAFPELPVVLVTAYGSIAKAVEAIQEGAADYLVKPFEAEVLIEMVERLARAPREADAIVIEDPRSREVAELARRVGATDASVMISGESGSGKEVYARLIHQSSPRRDAPYVAINCAAIPESMLESILFGYEKGAFTGAHATRAGKFEQANGGTLLLDEISEMALGLQAKLLRVIQEREVERLGGSALIDLDLRLIATTNRNLREEVAAGRFREDLFYRLNVFPLHLPPLRERPGDILPLARRLLERAAPNQGLRLEPDAEALLLAHHWGGNVRELENVIQRALILRSGTSVGKAQIIFEDLGAPPRHAAGLAQGKPALESDLKTREQEIIIDALARNGSRKEAAEKLGISPRTLRYKLAQFRKDGISIPCLPIRAS